MRRPIFTLLGPNYQLRDALLALWLLGRPLRWKIKIKKKELLVASGRDALYTILGHLNLQKGDEVLLQAYTCVVVPNAILAAGAKPVYVDVQDDTFNINPEELKKKITPQSKVLVVQHTFGRLADMDALMAIAKEHGLAVIEDCAHALGVPGAGERGLASFTSFGRDKCVSAVFGGQIRTKDPQLRARIEADIKARKNPSYAWIAQQLLHPVVVFFSKLTYNSIGKAAFALARKLHLLSSSVYQCEREGGQPGFVPAKMPSALNNLRLAQLRRLPKFTAHRQEMVRLYNQGLGKNLPEIPYLVYPLLHSRPDELRAKAKKQGIYLGDWYSQPIAPAGVDYQKINYTPGSCPVAEKLAGQTVNLPTHINVKEKDAQRIIEFLRKNA